MLRIIVSASLVIVLLVGGGTVSAAQSPVTTLPEALVTALMGSSSRISSQHPIYFVGQVPSGYPAALVPSGPVTLVGGMRDGSQTVAVFADSTRRLAAVFEQLFEAAGYRRPPRAARSWVLECNRRVSVLLQGLRDGVRGTDGARIARAGAGDVSREPGWVRRLLPAAQVG